MSKKNIYEFIFAIISDPESFLNWSNLEKTYESLNLSQEAEIIRNYKNQIFQEVKIDGDNSIARKK